MTQADPKDTGGKLIGQSVESGRGENKEAADRLRMTVVGTKKLKLVEAKALKPQAKR